MLLYRERYDLVISLAEAYLSNPVTKGIADSSRLLLIINLAASYKWSGNHSKCMELLREVDLSQQGSHYKLAQAALQGDYTLAAHWVKRAIADENLTDMHLEFWPVFREFRMTPEFRTVYREQFDREYTISQREEV